MLPPPPPVRGAARRRSWLRAAAVAVAVVVGTTGCSSAVGRPEPGGLGELAFGTVRPPLPRSLEAYRGQGAWVDVYDFVPAYAQGDPPLAPSAVDAMAERGVHTLFLQAARWDDTTPEGLIDRRLLWSFLRRAHEHGMFVVGWYLPKFDDVARDLDRLRQIRDFTFLGEQFDGIGVDIEYTEGVPDVGARNAALVALSHRFRAETRQMPISAIVIPAVQLEVVNEKYWPGFPYAEIAGDYDVWQPMAYWSFRSKPYDDGYRYVKESVDRLRNNLGNPFAVVNPIGGIADEVKDEHMVQFAQALRDVNAVGGGMYDWNTLPPGRQWLLRNAFVSGPARDLPPPPAFADRSAVPPPSSAAPAAPEPGG